MHRNSVVPADAKEPGYNPELASATRDEMGLKVRRI